MSTTAQLDTDINATPTECALPPPGWKCARKAGHDGPCAAVKYHLITNDHPWIGVDLDATLAHYDEWRGIDHIGPPIEAMQTRVKQWLSEGKHVRILTARVGPQRHDVPHTIEEITHHIEQWCLQHLGQVLPVTCQKDYNMVAFYDDRCMQVIPNDGTCVVDDFNQRLIDRTTGFMQTLGQQQLELNHLRTELRQEKEILSAFTEVYDLTPAPEDQTKYVPSHILALALRQRDQAMSQVADLQSWKDSANAVEAQWNPHRVAKLLNLTIGTDIRKEIEPKILEVQAQIERMIKHHQDSMETDSIVASCGCLTKTNDPQHHKPGCKYRLISERNEARNETAYCRQKIDELHAEIGRAKHTDLGYAAIAEQRDNALTALQQAYVHNQNMHCFVTKGRLNDQLNEQTHVLRKALGIPGAQPPEAAPVPYAAEKAAFEAGRKIEYTRLCVDNGCESWASWWAEVTDTPPDWNNERLRFRIAEEDPYQSEDYQRFVAKVAETCTAEDGPCDACLAGGICDGPSDPAEEEEQA